MTGRPIPTEAAAITPDWLEAALTEQDAARREVEAVTVLDAHSGTTGRARLRVDWGLSEGAGDRVRPSTVFAKLAPTDPIQRAWVVQVGMGLREVRFYQALAEELPIRVPAPLWTGATPDGGDYLLLLEDVEGAGCTVYHLASRDHDVLRHAQAMMTTLGTLHGHYTESERFAGDLSWVSPPRRDPVGPQLVHEALEAFGQDMSPAFRALGALYVEHTEAVSDRLDKGATTLAHGDCHIGNTFTDGDRVGLLDWALVCRAPGLRDVAYYLCNSLPVEVRRAETPALLTRYLDAVARAGAPAPTLAEASDALQEHALTSWVAVVVTAAVGDRMQSLEAGQLSMARATAAIEDFDTAGRLRAAL
jgi:aminoglycoside phosphotransferase (APT) family kinase protein